MHESQNNFFCFYYITQLRSQNRNFGFASALRGCLHFFGNFGQTKNVGFVTQTLRNTKMEFLLPGKRTDQFSMALKPLTLISGKIVHTAVLKEQGTTRSTFHRLCSLDAIVRHGRGPQFLLLSHLPSGKFVNTLMNKS